jgi:hypothetical protein
MMRIAKIAEDDGGADTGGPEEAGGSLRGRAAGGGVDAGRGGGGLDAGRGGAATGRGELELGFRRFSAPIPSTETASLAATAGSDGERAATAGSDGERAKAAGSDGERAATAGSDGERAATAGSDGERVVVGDPASSLSLAGNDGFERRRGIGGGALSGAVPLVGTGGKTGMSLASWLEELTPVVPASCASSLAPSAAEYEIVGAMGALSALDASALSSPESPGGRTDGGLEADPESRFGFGGGASFREVGATES